MTNTDACIIDNDIINQLGLVATTEKINATISPDARVFKYPHLDKVYIMENDLYGNTMPLGFCFLAFYGEHGLIGRELTIETLKSNTVEDMQAMVAVNKQG